MADPANLTDERPVMLFLHILKTGSTSLLQILTAGGPERSIQAPGQNLQTRILSGKVPDDGLPVTRDHLARVAEIGLPLEPRTQAARAALTQMTKTTTHE